MKTADRNITGFTETRGKISKERGQTADRKKGTEEEQISERKKACFIMIITAVFVMMSSLGCHKTWAADNENNAAKSYVTTRETGPVTQHIPQIFTVDCATDEVRNVTNGGEGEFVCYGINGTPILFPGDIVRFIPAPGSDHARKGYYFPGDNPLGHGTAQTFACLDDGKVHVEVTETSSWGNPNSITGENTYINEITIVGDELVRIQSWGGGDYTGYVDENDIGHSYTVANLDFVYIPAWCRLNTELWVSFNSAHLMTDEEAATAAYYDEAPGTDTVWAADGIANSLANEKGEEKPVLLSLRRPYIEGFFFTGTSSWPELETNQISSVYHYTDGPNWNGNFWEGWISNQLEYHPLLDNWGGKFTGNCAGGSYDDELLVRMIYEPGRTLTFDACGGTIEGYPTRIYEAAGSRQFFDEELRNGTVDAQLAAGQKYIPVREGYIFDGWYEDPEYTAPVTSILETVEKYSTNSYEPDERRICRVYAKWEPETKSIAKASIAGVSLSYGYSGKAYEPVMTVKVDGETLSEGVDYTVAYKNNIDPGTATITLTGIGKYTDTRIKTFEIVDCASKIEDGKTYQLIPKNNSKTAVCSFSGRMVINTKVYITDRSSSEAMRFKAVKNPDGTWKFINAKCEMALAVQQNSSEVGKGLVLYNQTAKTAQNWKLSKKSDNSYAIMNAVSGLSIAMSDTSAVKGTTLSMAETASSGLQRFYIVETDPVNSPYSGEYAVKAAKNRTFGLNIASSAKTDGANVNLYTYSNTAARRFRLRYSGGGYYRIENVNSGLVLTVKGNTKTDGANVIQSAWAAKSGQRWKVRKNSDGTVTITNVLGTVLHLSGNKTVNGTNVIAKTKANTTAQRWYLNS